MSDETTYSMALPFDTDNAEFLRGVEVGILWTELQEFGPISATVHATNAEMMLRLAESTGREVRSEELGDDWLIATFTHPESAR